jgi:malate synthase
VTVKLFREIMGEELARIEQALDAEAYAGRAFAQASAIFDQITTADTFVEFLTLPAYEYLP